MTVKELIRTVKADNYAIISGGMTIPLDPDDPLQMDAYGSFVVDNAIITPEGPSQVEINLRTTFIREDRRPMEGTRRERRSN